MPELSFAPAPPRDELLRQLRQRLPEALPGLRWVATDVLGEGARIDFVGVGDDGHVALVLVGDAGEDLALVARALAQRAWLEPRLRDWIQLAPDLGLRPEAGVRVLLLCPAFGSESRSAARALGESAPMLVSYRCVRNGAGVEPLLDAPDPAPALPGRAGASEMARPSRPETSPAGAAPSGFRTGLTEADLQIRLEEGRELE